MSKSHDDKAVAATPSANGTPGVATTDSSNSDTRLSCLDQEGNKVVYVDPITAGRSFDLPISSHVDAKTKVTSYYFEGQTEELSAATKEELVALVSNVPNLSTFNSENCGPYLQKPNTYLLRFGRGTKYPDSGQAQTEQYSVYTHALTYSRELNGLLNVKHIQILHNKDGYRVKDSLTSHPTVNAAVEAYFTAAKKTLAPANLSPVVQQQVQAEKLAEHKSQITPGASAQEYHRIMRNTDGSVMSVHEPYYKQQLILNAQAMPASSPLTGKDPAHYSSMRQMAQTVGFALPTAGATSFNLMIEANKLKIPTSLCNLHSTTNSTTGRTTPIPPSDLPKIMEERAKIYLVGHCNKGSSSIQGTEGSYGYQYYVNAIVNAIDPKNPPKELRLSVIACFAGAKLDDHNPSFAEKLFVALNQALKSNEGCQNIKLEIVARTSAVSRQTATGDYHNQDDRMVMVHEEAGRVVVAPVKTASGVELYEDDPDQGPSAAVTASVSSSSSSTSSVAAVNEKLALASLQQRAAQIVAAAASASSSSSSLSLATGEVAAAPSTEPPTHSASSSSSSSSSSSTGVQLDPSTQTEGLKSQARTLLTAWVTRLDVDKPKLGFFGKPGKKYELYQELTQALNTLNTLNNDPRIIIKALESAREVLDTFVGINQKVKGADMSSSRNQDIKHSYNARNAKYMDGSIDDTLHKIKFTNLIDQLNKLEKLSSPKPK